MREKLFEAVIPFIALSFSIYYFITVVEAPWEAKIYSFALIVGILVCSVLIVIKTYLLNSSAAKPEAETGKNSEAPGRKFPIILVASMVFVVSIYVIGYIFSAFLFVLSVPFLLGYRKKSIWITAVVVIGLIYILFVAILKLNLPVGILFG